MRWLLAKDLRILRRSPLLVTLLAVYPVVVALLIGAALTGGPEKPRVAFANLAGDAEFSLGGETLTPDRYTARLFEAIDPIRVSTREEAIAKVRDGDALAALVVPADAADRLQGMLTLSGGEPPTIEVFYNAEDPVKRRYVESTIRSRLSEANAALSDAVLAQSAKYIDLIVTGGKLSFPLVGEVDILGLRNARTLIETSLRGLPEDAPERPALEQVSRFARLAADNLDLSKPILNSIGQPVRVKQTVVEGLQDAAGPVRGLRGRDAVADARDRAAGRRAAGAGARGERLRAPARGCSRPTRCWPRRSCSPRPPRSSSRCCSSRSSGSSSP